jgi:hypothetical protein
MDQNARWQARFIEAINRGSGIYRIQAGNGIASPVRPLDNFYQDHVEKFRMSIVSQLYYAQMESRSESVKDPYRATFQWIFSLPPTEQNFSTNQNWSNFVHFLESDQSLYWITGKAGSGKSSLMKLIKEDKQTAYHLGKWAGDKALYISGFYFWSAGGDEIQMTQEGLLRTLIHQALRTFPGLAPLMFPGRIETFMVLGYEFAWEESLVRFRYHFAVLRRWSWCCPGIRRACFTTSSEREIIPSSQSAWVF